MVEPGKASGTTGSTVARQCGHQYRGMVCSVTTGVMSAGMSSMIRVREERHARTGPWHLGHADSVCSWRRSIRGGVGRRCPGCPGLAPLGLARPLVVGLTYAGVCPDGVDGSGVVETTTCFSASCLAKDNKAKTTASAPCAEISRACSSVSCGPSKACKDAVSRVSVPAVAMEIVECRGHRIARSTELG